MKKLSMFRSELRKTNAAKLAMAVAMVCVLASAFSFADQDTKSQRPRRVESETKPSPTPAIKPSGDEIDEGDVIRVNTQLVSVPTIVTDQAGKPITGLGRENFIIYEDGKPQTLTNFATTDAPFEVALLLDTSGSTRADIDLIRSAANLFINSLRKGDRVGIIAYYNSENISQPAAAIEVLTTLTSDRPTLRDALERVGASHGTPFYDSLVKVADGLFSEPPRDEVRGRRAVVALTDGVDSSSTSDFDYARLHLQRAGVTCYFIVVNTEDFVEDRVLRDCQDSSGIYLSASQLERYRKAFVPNADPADYQNFCKLGPFERMEIGHQLYELARKEMNEIARSSGGRTFAAGDLRDAGSAFSQVAAEIGTQYSLGYYPTNKSRDGQHRRIRVELRKAPSGARVRAREGYNAPKR